MAFGFAGEVGSDDVTDGAQLSICLTLLSTGGNERRIVWRVICLGACASDGSDRHYVRTICGIEESVRGGVATREHDECTKSAPTVCDSVGNRVVNGWAVVAR